MSRQHNPRKKFRLWPFLTTLSLFCICLAPCPVSGQASGTAVKGQSTRSPNGQESLPATPESAKDSKEDWNVLYMGKARMGYSRSCTFPIERLGQKLIRSENESFLSIKRFGQELKMKIAISTEETPEGELKSVEYRSDNPPASFSKTLGVVEGDQLKLTIEAAGQKREKKLAWDKSVKSPAYQDRMLLETPLKPGESRDFRVFLPEMNQVTTVSLKEKGEESVTLLDGQKRKLKRIDVTQSILPGMVTKTWVDAEGNNVMSSTAGFLGTSMSTYRVTREEALKQVVGAELDIAVDTLIKIQPPLKNAHASKKIVYGVTLKGHDPVKVLPQGDTQTLVSTGPESADLTVISLRPEDSNSGSGVADAEFLQPNRYLQSDDAAVIEHASSAAGEETDPWKMALKMESYVHKTLSKKNFSTALGTAAEVAKSLEGDCTEHACLLAAMCRTKGIPSRVVVGLVYAESLQAFGGHMWTEVLIKKNWIPLDATLGKGGIGAAHVKMSDTSLSDESGAVASCFVPILRVIGNLTLTVKSAE